MRQPNYSTELTAALMLAVVLGCSGPKDKDEVAPKLEDSTAQSGDTPSAQAKDAKKDKGVVGEKNSASEPTEISLADVREILKPREVEVEVMGLAMPDDMKRISAQLDKSARENTEWLLDYVKREAKQGKPLPFHPNFGVTEDEYRRYFDFLRSMKLVPAKKARLKFTTQGDSKTLIKNVEGLPEFDGIIVDYELDLVVTPWGTVPADKQNHAGEGSWLGKWDAYYWDLKSGDFKTGTATKIEFGVGRQASTSRNIIHYRAVPAWGGVKAVETEIIIRFE